MQTYVLFIRFIFSPFGRALDHSATAHPSWPNIVHSLSVQNVFYSVRLLNGPDVRITITDTILVF